MLFPRSMQYQGKPACLKRVDGELVIVPQEGEVVPLLSLDKDESIQVYIENIGNEDVMWAIKCTYAYGQVLAEKK